MSKTKLSMKATIINPSTQTELFEETKRQIEKAGGDTSQIEAEDLAQLVGDETLIKLFQPSALADKNQIIIYKDGSPMIYDVHPDIYNSISDMSPEMGGLVVDFLSAMASIQKAGIITYPRYLAYNLARDTGHNLVSSKHDINPFDLAMGMRSILTKDMAFEAMQAQGGATNFFSANDRQFAQDAKADMSMDNKRLRESLNEFSKGHAIKGLYHISRAFDKPMQAGEMAGRMAEYKKALKKYGMSEQEIKDMMKAHTKWNEFVVYLNAKSYDNLSQTETDKLYKEYLSTYGQDPAAIAQAIADMRNLSVDFRRIGRFVKKNNLNRYINFLNSQLQGTYNSTMLLKRKKTWLKGFIALTLPMIFLNWLTDDNEYYNELPGWRKDFFYNIPIGDPKTTSVFLPVPAPWELAIIFKAIPERLVEHWKGEGHSFEGLGESLSTTFLPSFVPSAIEPSWLDFAGKTWNNRTILNQGDENVSPYLQRNDYTSEFSKMIGTLTKDLPLPTNKLLRNSNPFTAFRSPKRLDTIIKGTTGSWGAFALNATDMALGKKTPDVLLRTLIVDAKGNPLNKERFYNNKGKLDMLNGDAGRLKDSNEGQLTMRTIGLRKDFAAALKAIGKADDEIAKVEGDTQMDAKNKKLYVDATKTWQLQEYKRLNKMFDEWEKLPKGDKVWINQEVSKKK